MKIEHWKAQSKYPDEQLVYANLLAACLGNEGQPPEDQTCDTKKADNDLSRNPAYPIPSIEDMVWYIDGRIGSNNAAFHQELETVLNLNAQHLISNRKSVVNSLQTRLKLILNLKPKAQRNQLQRLYDRYSANAQNGHLEPYCTVITYLVGKLLVTAPPVPNQSGT